MVAGTGFVVESGAPDTRDFEVIVLNAHTFFDKNCKRRSGPFNFSLNRKQGRNRMILHLYRVGTQCPYNELGKDWAVAILFGRRKELRPIDFEFLDDYLIVRASSSGFEFNLIGLNVARDRIDSVNVQHAECQPIAVPKRWVRERRHGLDGDNILHNCPTDAGVSGGPLVARFESPGGTRSYLAFGIHSGELFSSRSPTRFDLKHNANVAVRFGHRLTRAIRSAGAFKRFSDFQAEMRTKDWSVISRR
jgi:hypothetical protein